MSDGFEEAQCALLAIHEFLPGEDVTSPLETLIERFRTAVLAPDANASAHSDHLRQSTASLLYNSSTPPDLLKWLASTDSNADKEITASRKRAFDVLTEHLVKYFDEARKHAHVLLTQVMRSVKFELGSDSPRVAALRCLRKALRRLPHDAALMHADKCGRGDREEIIENNLISVETVWSLLMSELRHGHPTRKSKSMGMIECLLKTLGLIAECYQNSESPWWGDEVRKLVQISTGNLAANFEGAKMKKPEMAVVAGSFACLERCWRFCAVDGEFMWRCCRMSIGSFTTQEGKIHRYEVPSKALRFLSRHAEKLIGPVNILSGDLSRVLPKIRQCALSSATKVKGPGEVAYESCFASLAHYSSTNPDSKLSAICEAVVSELVDSLEDSTTTSREVLASLQPIASFVACGGLNALSVSLRSRLLSQLWLAHDRPVNVQEPLVDAYGGDAYLAQEKQLNAETSSYPLKITTACLRSACSIFVQSSDDGLASEEGDVSRIDEMVEKCFKEYPFAGPTARVLVKEALSFVFSTLDTNALSTLLGKGGKAGVVLAAHRETLSRPQAMPHFDELGHADPRLCWAYTTLWSYLLNDGIASSRSVKSSAAILIEQKEGQNGRSDRTGILLGFLLEECLLLINKLDLSYSTLHGGIVSSNAFNHDIMLNHVTFLEHTLVSLPAFYFKPWASIFLHGIMTKSRELPLVSALYRLAALGLNLAHDAGLLGDGHDSENLQEALRVYLTFVGVAASRFSDELLCTALRLLLSPPALAVCPPSSALPPLRLALGKANSHLPTAEVAIAALEHWHFSDQQGLKVYLKELLPLLQPLLFDARKRTEENRNEGDKVTNIVESTAALVALQRRIVVFLGRLGGEANKLVIPADEALRSVLAWEELPPDTLPLYISFPLTGSKFGELTLQLPELLPRISDLCTGKGADMHTRALAAECLHASILYLVGSAATDASNGLGSQKYLKLWKQMFTVVIELAVDSESSTRLLFSKLLNQLIHWFSNASAREEEATALLLALSDGIASEDHQALREICASSMAEFSRYAIKQSTSKQISQSPIAADRLIVRLKTMATHPDRCKRSGATLAFSHICKGFREQVSLVSRHALSLCHAFLVSLRRSHLDHAALEVSSAAAKAVSDVAKIVMLTITRYNDNAKLLKPNPDRGFPSSLDDLVEYLWEHLASPEVAFHAKCTELFYTFAPLLSGKKLSSQIRGIECKKWISTKKGDLKSTCMKCFDSTLQAGNTSTSGFLFALLGSIDTYIWAMKYVVSVEEIFDGKQGSKKGFLSYLCLFASTTNQLIEDQATTDEWGELRVKILRRICTLLTIVASCPESVSEVISSGLWDRPLHSLLMRCILALPTDSSGGSVLPSITDDCSELKLYFPTTFEQLLVFNKVYDDHMSLKGSSFGDFVTTDWAAQYWQIGSLKLGQIKTTNILRSFRLLHKHGLLSDISDLTPLSENLRSITEFQEPLDPLVRVDAAAFLATAIDLGWPIQSSGDSLLSSLLDVTLVDVSGKQVPRGSVLHTRLRGDIESVLLRPDVFPNVAAHLLSTASSASILCFEQLANHMLHSLAPHLVSVHDFLVASFKHFHYLNVTLASPSGLDRLLCISEAVLRLDARLTSQEQLNIRSIDVFRRGVIAVLELGSDVNGGLNLKLSALRLLPFLIPGVAFSSPLKVTTDEITQNEFDDLLSGVEEMTVNHFPLRSNEQSKSCALETVYLTLLSEIVKVSVKGGTLVLFSKILTQFKEGDVHRYAGLLHKGLRALSAKVDVLHQESVYSALAWVLKLIFNEREPSITRSFLLDMFLLPLLKRTPSDRLLDIATQCGVLPFGRVKPAANRCLMDNILDLLLKSPSISTTDNVFDYFFKRSVAMGILEQIYDGLNETLLEVNITKNERFDSEQKLNMKICKYLYTASRKSVIELLGNHPSNQEEEEQEEQNIIQHYKAAAYSCLCIIVMATQKKNKLFVSMLWQTKGNDKIPLSELLKPNHNYIFRPFLSKKESVRRVIWPNALRLNSSLSSSSSSKSSSFAPTYMDSSFSLSHSDMSMILEPSMAAELTGSQSVQEDEQAPDLMIDDAEPLPTQETQTKVDSRVRGGGGEEDETQTRRDVTDVRDRLGYATLELSDLNNEQCMPCAIRSIIKYHELFHIGEGNDESIIDLNEQPPLWLSEMIKMLSSSQPRNVRLFGLKLLLNEDIRPLCKKWVNLIFKPVLLVAIEELNKIEQGFHTLLQELCFCLNDTNLWECESFDDDLSSQFISHLLAVCFVNSSGQLKQNLADITALLIRWHPRDLDLGPVADLLETEFRGSGGSKGKALSSNSKEVSGTESWMRRRLGLHLVAGLFAAEYPCLAAMCPDAPRIARGLADSCVFGRREVYTTAAAVCGDALQYLDSMAMTPCSEAINLQANIVNILKPLASAKELPHLVIVISRITTIYPSFLSRELSLRLLNHFPHLKSRERASLLSCLTEMQAKHQLPIFDHLRPYIPALLTDATLFNTGGVAKTSHWVPAVQLAAVSLFAELCLDLDGLALGILLAPNTTHGVIACSTSTCRELRARSYQLMCKLYTSHSLLNGRKEGATEIRHAVRCALLRGLTDPDEDLDLDEIGKNEQDDLEDDEYGEYGGNNLTDFKTKPPVSIRQMMFDYWSDAATYKGVKSNGIVGVMERLLNELWDPSVADHWVHFASYLLLDQSAQAPTFTSKHFRQSLGDCSFHALRVDGGGMRAAPMVPMLSLESQMALSQDASYVLPTMLTDDVSQLAPGFIKATAELNWSMTQAGRPMDVYGEGTQDASTSGESTVQTGSVTIGKTSMAAPSRRRVSEKSRFYSSQVEAQRRRNLSTQASSSARKRKVSLLRSYRDGELPDIQALSVSEIIRPLQALILKDAFLARTAFSWLFTEVFQIQAQNTGAQRAMGGVLEGMLQQAPHQTDLVGCLLGAARRIVTHPVVRGDGFNLSAVVVAEASLRSLNYHSGILLLEEVLLLRLNERMHDDQSYDEANESEWLQLSRLYGALGEKDVLLGLSKRSAKHDDTREALKLEQMGNFNKAILFYNKLISMQKSYNADDMVDDEEFVWEKASEAESTTWKQRSLECCRQLCDWEQVHDASIGIAGGVEELWDETIRDWALPQFLRSLVAEPRYHLELREFLDNNLKVSGRREWLETRLTCEVAMAAALDRDWSRLSHYATLGYREFLSAWGGLHPCATAAKKLALGGLQRLVELEDLSDCAVNSMSGASGLEEKVTSLLKLWDRQQPDLYDLPAVWGDLAVDRTLGLHTLLECFDPVINDQSISSQLKSSTDKHIANIHFLAATAAVKHGNKTVAKLLIKKASDLLTTDLSLDPMLNVARVRAVSAFNLAHLDVKPTKRLASIEKTKGVIANAVSNVKENNNREIKEELSLLQGKWTELQYDLFKSGSLSDGDVDMSQVTKETLSLFGDGGSSAQAHMAIASFYDKMLLQWAEPSTSEPSSKRAKVPRGPLIHDPQITAGEVASSIITHTLEALKIGEKGSNTASFTIPRLLQLLKLYPECIPTFMSASEDVPTWPFLRWTSQLCALLDRDVEGTAVVCILERMARDYPQAIRFPYGISLESLTQSSGSAADKPRINATLARTAKLSNMLADESCDSFMKALNSLQHPEIWLMDMVKIIRTTYLTDQENPQFSLQLAKETYLEVYQQLFDDPRKMGSYNREFANQWKRQVESIFGKNGEKIERTDSFKKTLAKLHGETQRAKGGVKGGHQLLSMFSPWLSDYDGSSSVDNALEVPGQYWCPTEAPNPSAHARIASFDKEILTLTSLRMPKRLTILGDDEKERNFLVKGGEDLRNDERIEQLLTLMNSILKKDGQCANAGLGVRTYSVIPLTTQIGLVEWVPNTQPIKAFIGEGFNQLDSNSGKKKTSSNKSPQDMFKATSEEYRKVVMKNDTTPKGYHAMFKNVSASKVISQFQQVTKMVPADVLRKQLMSMASSPEVFLTCRNEFARTFAVWSIAGYVLGIGDRHLDNFLIDKRSGQIVPIDFGMAFGMASSLLPVPELLPFRLTGQFGNLLRPLDSLGLLSHHAVLAMTAFKVESTVLVRTMDVFLQDPIVDWVACCAQKRQKDEGDDEGSSGKKTNKKTTTWEPWRRIRNAQRKLNGYNPMEIMLDDLRQNNVVNKEGSISALEKIVRGKEAVKNPPDRQHMAALQEEHLGVTDQVACLIDIATDQNILARQWLGLCTWI